MAAAANAPKSEAARVMESTKKRLVPNYKPQPIVVDRGEGAYLWDTDGKRYLDLFGGVATCALGHCHPEVTKAVKAQLDKVWHVSNALHTIPQADLAAALCEASGLDRAFFCNSGAEANEALIKLARKAQKDAGHPERFEIIAFESSFHGRTLTTVSATGQPKYQEGFEPLTPGFKHVPYGDIDAVRAAVGSATGAILVETIQGEGGIHVAPEGYLGTLRELCDEKGLLLLIDEIQTGMGRTGKLFGFQHAGILPDAISLAKALGNGLPIGAMLCREKPAQSLGPGTHGSTFGGNPVAAAGALATLGIIQKEETLAEVRRKGEHLRAEARRLKEAHPDKVKAVRGQGLLVGIELEPAIDVRELSGGLRELGYLVNMAGPRTLRFAPPFLVTEAELTGGINALGSLLEKK